MTTGRRFVIATDPDGRRCAVGPVFKDESEEKLREELFDEGWSLDDDAVPQVSASDFRAQKAGSR